METSLRAVIRFDYLVLVRYDPEKQSGWLEAMAGSEELDARLKNPDGTRKRQVSIKGIEHVKQFPDAIKIALKETSLAGSKIYIGGSGSNNLDIQTYARNDLLIAAMLFYDIAAVAVLALGAG